MSLSRTMASRYEDDEHSSSPTNERAHTVGHETLFDFFRKKSKRDLDRSYSSARRTGRKNDTSSPNVQLLKELNTSSSPFKAKRPTTATVSPFRMTTTANQSPFKLLSPFNVADSKSSSGEEDEKPIENSRKTGNPLFVKLIQNGSLKKKKSDAPTVPRIAERFSASVPRERPNQTNTNTERLNTHPHVRDDEELAPVTQSQRPAFGPRFSTPIQKLNSNSHGQENKTTTKNQREDIGRRFSASLARDDDQSNVDLLNEINPRVTTFTNTLEKGGKSYADVLDELDAQLSTQTQNKKEETLNQRTRLVPRSGDANPNTQATPKRAVRAIHREKPVETNWAKNSLGPYIEEYEHKSGELSSIVQRQLLQISKLADTLDEIENFDTSKLRVMVEDIELNTVTVSKYLKDGLFDVHGSSNLVEKIELQYKEDIRRLNNALDHARATIKTEKTEHDLKLEELLNYTESLKRKQAIDASVREKSSGRDRRAIRHSEYQNGEFESQIPTVEMLKKDVRQLTSRNQDLAEHVKGVEKENQSFRQQNYKLKESEELLKEDVRLLRSQLDEALMKLNRQQLAPERRHSKSGQREDMRQNSPGRTLKGVLKKSGRIGAHEHEGDQSKTEADYLNYRLDILTKENEDLVRRLTDKVFIERENKTLLIKNQELMEALKSKVKENDHLTKSLNEIQERVVQGTNYPIYAAVTKHYALDEKSRGRMTHW